MCVIINNSNGAQIGSDVLEQATIDNPHGGGIIDVSTGEVIHSMSMKRVLAEMRKRKRWISHCRWATVGPKTLDNCHPYPIKDDWFLMMNGTVRITCPTNWSDTKTIAKKVLRFSEPNEWDQVLSCFDSARFIAWKHGCKPIITGRGWIEEGSVGYSKKIYVKPPVAKRKEVQFRDLEDDPNAVTRFERLASFEREMQMAYDEYEAEKKGWLF
jgi:hypothetical protein